MRFWRASKSETAAELQQELLQMRDERLLEIAFAEGGIVERPRNSNTYGSRMISSGRRAGTLF